MLLVCCGFLAGTVRAQHVRITGTVADARTGRGLADTHVFIAESMIGTVTDGEGAFLLPRVPAGAHRLFVSMLGYESSSIDTLVSPGGRFHFEVRLEPAVIEMKEIVVSARQARRWQRQLVKFTRLFLGLTDNAALTGIANPEVLDFTARWGRLTASANLPLEIVNRGLGYRVLYYLEEFEQSGGTIKYDGDPLFEELEAADEEEAARWEANRRAAFFGSMRHYMLSLRAARTESEGFSTFRRHSLDRTSGPMKRFGVDLERLLQSGPTPDEKELSFGGFLEVEYAGETESEAYGRFVGRSGRRAGLQRSWLRLNRGPTLIDRYGEFIDPYGVVEYGYFAFERIADDLPKEYRPVDWPR